MGGATDQLSLYEIQDRRCSEYVHANWDCLFEQRTRVGGAAPRPTKHAAERRAHALSASCDYVLV